MNYHEVETQVNKFLPNSLAALRIVLAVAASGTTKNRLMLWLLLVGPPSSGKTDLVRLIKESKSVFYLDNLTLNAFISGERETDKEKVHDLLPHLNRKCLVIKDWTSIFSLDEKMTKKILGELVGIYDKEFAKFSSRRGLKSYTSEFSQLGCITPSTLNKHSHYMNMVGPRFLCYILPLSTVEEEEAGFDLLFSDQDRSVLEDETRKVVSSYLDHLNTQTFSPKPLTAEVKRYIKVAARLVSNCRGIAIMQSSSFRNEEGDEVKYYELVDHQIEAPWRATQQLILFVQYLTFVAGKDDIGPEELEIVKEVVISSMPADRSHALRALKDCGGELAAKQLAENSEKSDRTSRRLLAELAALKVVEKIPGSSTTANNYRIVSQFADFVLLRPAEFLSIKTSRTEIPPHVDNLTPEGDSDEPFPY